MVSTPIDTLPQPAWESVFLLRIVGYWSEENWSTKTIICVVCCIRHPLLSLAENRAIKNDHFLFFRINDGPLLGCLIVVHRMTRTNIYSCHDSFRQSFQNSGSSQNPPVLYQYGPTLFKANFLFVITLRRRFECNHCWQRHVHDWSLKEFLIRSKAVGSITNLSEGNTSCGHKII